MDRSPPTPGEGRGTAQHSGGHLLTGPSPLPARAGLPDDSAMAAVLSYLAAAITGLWGIAHAVPTRQVVAGFRDTSTDNRRILLQEWLAEAITMWTLAALVTTVTTVAGGTAAADWTDRITAGALLILAVLTALTGARTLVIWFKICPVLLGGSAALLLLASFS